MKNAVMENYELNANTALVLKFKLENFKIFYIGEESPTLTNLLLTINQSTINH